MCEQQGSHGGSQQHPRQYSGEPATLHSPQASFAATPTGLVLVRGDVPKRSDVVLQEPLGPVVSPVEADTRLHLQSRLAMVVDRLHVEGYCRELRGISHQLLDDMGTAPRREGDVLPSQKS